MTPYAGRELTGVVRRTWLRGQQLADGGAPLGRLLGRGARSRYCCRFSAAASSKVFGSVVDPARRVGVAEGRLGGQVLDVVLGAGLQVVVVGLVMAASGGVGGARDPARTLAARGNRAARRRENDDRLRRSLPDLARRALGGAVVAANDEFFAARENLVLPHPAVARTEFGHKGKEYDGWETRRRRSPGHDWAIVRLGAPGIVGRRRHRHRALHRQLPAAGLASRAPRSRATASVDELAKADWQPLLPLSDLAGNTANAFPVDSDRRVTHVRLTIHPDGGVARLRVHGTVARPTRGWSTPARSTSPRWRTAAG